MEQLDVVALGATKEVFEDVKSTLPLLNKKVKKLKYKKGNEVQCFELLEKIQRYNSKLEIISMMYENDNLNQLYKEAKEFSTKNLPMTNNLMKSIHKSLPKDKILEIAKENNLKLIPSIFANFETQLKGFISNGTMIRIIPSAIKMNKITQKSDKLSNAYKIFLGKIIVDNKEKSNDEIIELILQHLEEKQKIYKSTELEDMKYEAKGMKLMKKVLKIKKTNTPEYDCLNTFGIFETFEPVTSIFKEFEKFAIRNKKINSLLLEKTHGKNADALNLLIDNIKNQPTLSIKELKETYVNALKEFDPEIASFAKKFTTSEGRYDLSIRESKPNNMAFTLMSEDSKGFISSHYDKTLTWQSTVAHEWGHSLQLERSKTTLNNMEWQPIVVEKPSILSEYIYLNYLKAKTKDSKQKISILNEIIDSGLSRFYQGALRLRWGRELFEKYNSKLSPIEAFKYYDQLLKEIGYKDLKLKSKSNKYFEDLRKFDTPSVMLYQYIPAQAIAIMMYEKLKAKEMKLGDIYDNPLKIVDLVDYCKSNDIDITSSKGFNVLLKVFKELLDEKEELINNL